MHYLTARMLNFGLTACMMAVLHGCVTHPNIRVNNDRENGDFSNGGTGSSGSCMKEARQCFGAVAVDCDGATPNEWAIAGNLDSQVLQIGCIDGSCWINAGSWQHDECCVINPGGRWCGGLSSANKLGCVNAWNKATHRVFHNLGWRRYVDTCRIDSDGLVNFSEYCAPDGTVIAEEDQNRCCSGISRDYISGSDSGTGVGEPILDGSFKPVVCKALPIINTGPKACITQAQCKKDEICIKPSSSNGTTQKYCLPI